MKKNIPFFTNKNSNETTTTANANVVKTEKLTVKSIQSLVTLSARKLYEKLQALSVIPGTDLTNVVNKEKTNNSRRWMIMMFILVVMGVFGYFAQAGADYVMNYGRRISLFMTALGMTFVIITALRWWPKKMKAIVIFAELVLMTFNAYVMPGFFASSSIGTQAESMVARDVESANKTIENIGTFYTLNNAVNTNAVNIALIEEKRDGKGVMYQTAMTIAGKFPKMEMPARIKVPAINKNVGSLSEMNNELIRVHQLIAEEVGVKVQEANGIRSAAQGTVDQVNKIAQMQLSEAQSGNALALKGDIVNMADSVKFVYNDKPQVLRKGDLQIDGFVRILPYLLDIFVIGLMLWLISVTYPSEKQSEIAKLQEDSQIAAIRKLLAEWRIKYNNDDLIVNDTTFALLAFLEENTEFVKVAQRQDVTFSELSDLKDEFSETILLACASNHSQFQLLDLLQLHKGDRGMADKILYCFKVNDWNDLKEVTEHGYSVLSWYEDDVKMFISILNQLRLALNPSELAAHVDMMLTDMYNSDDIAELLKVWQTLVTSLNKKTKKAVLIGINVSLLSNLTVQTASKYACDIINSLTTEKPALDIQAVWNTVCNSTLIEWIKKGYYEDLITITQRASRFGRHGVLPLFSAYNIAKQKLNKENDEDFKAFTAANVKPNKPVAVAVQKPLNEAQQMVAAEKATLKEELTIDVQPETVQFEPKKLAINMESAFQQKITTTDDPGEFVALLAELFIIQQ